MALSILALVTLGALLGPEISHWQADEIDWEAIETPPSASHWFGTDVVGRDLFVRTMEGARVSLLIALIAVSVSLAIGIPWGAVAGLADGHVDQVMMPKGSGNG